MATTNAVDKKIVADRSDREIGFKRQQKTGLALFATRPEAGAILATLVIFFFFAIFAKNFLSLGVFANVALTTANLGTIAIGATMLMIAGEFDLSVGSIFGLAAGICVLMLNAAVPALVAIPVTLVVVACAGTVNGLLVTKLRIHSLIVTLGGLMFYRGIMLAITGGFPIRLESSLRPTLLDWFSVQIWGFLPASFVWFAALVAVLSFILTSTKLGNWIFATGGESNAAREMGVPTHRVKIEMFALTSVLAGLAGIMQMARYNSVDALSGNLMELEAVLAVVVGGASLNGGYGSIVGAALGVLMLSMIKQGLLLMGINAEWYKAGVGLILIVAAVVNQYVRERNT